MEKDSFQCINCGANSKKSEIMCSYCGTVFKSLYNKKNKKKSFINPQDSSISNYLNSIGRVPVLTPAQEITLAKQVKEMNLVLSLPKENRTKNARSIIKLGEKAKNRMMSSNLRLVISIAKTYQNKGLELLDLVQEGAIGLERAVDKFDPDRGYEFTDYASWWIRQAICVAIDNNSKTIYLSDQLSEKLSEIKKVSRELSHKLGRQPTRLEVANEMGIDQKDLEDLSSLSDPSASLEDHARGEENREGKSDLKKDFKRSFSSSKKYMNFIQQYLSDD